MSAATPTAATRAGPLGIARLAWRESRRARRRLLLYMSSIAVGVAALVAIDSFARNVTRSVQEQARTLMGGDVQLTAREPLPASARRLVDSLRRTGVRSTTAVAFPSMATVARTGATRLAQVHGVGAGYPLYGAITTNPAGRYPLLQRGPYALVDTSFLIATGSHIGDTLTIGYGRFTVLATLRDVPGTSGLSSAFGPRIYIPARYVPETRLLGFGSTAEYRTLLALPAGTDPQAFVRPLRPRLDSLRVGVRTVTQSQASAQRAIESLADFIAIAGLTALLLGGIGVASGVRAFVARKIDTVAIFRCLGATGGEVLTMYVAQAAAMGVLAACAGALLGVAVQFALPHAVADLLPVDVGVTVEPRAIATGLATGAWIALVFALRPLLALRGVSPLQALRRDTDAAVLRTRWRDLPRLAVDAALVASVVVVALLHARTRAQGLWLAAATLGAVVVLTAVATALAALARRTLRRGWPYVVRQGVANLYRPGNQTRPVVLALGFGAFLVTTLYLVQANVVRNVGDEAASSGANLVFFDVQSAQAAPLDSTVRARGFRVVQQAPVVAMRIAAVNGVPVTRLLADTAHGRRAPWALRREYRSTFRDSLQGGERLVAGHWFRQGAGAFAPGDTGEVSLDERVAGELGVHPGDVLTWDVQGVRIPTRVTSLRSVRWMRFEPNFFAVFPTRVLARAPRQYVLLADVPGATNVATLQRDIVGRYPNVSSIDLTLVTQTIGRIVAKVTTAVRFMALFTLLMAVPVLFSAVSATRRERVHEGVLLKTLGATRAQIGRILLTEYALLGLLGSATGLLLALGGGAAVVHYVFHWTYVPAITPAVLIAAALLILAIAIGLLAGRDVFRETAMAALRDGS